MYLVHIYAYPYKYTYIQVLMAQNSCISQPYYGAAVQGAILSGDSDEKVCLHSHSAFLLLLQPLVYTRPVVTLVSCFACTSQASPEAAAWLLHVMCKHHQMLTQSGWCGAFASAPLSYDIGYVPALQACLDEVTRYNKMC